MFNLMRILYSRRCNGSLEMINAVLGSGVVLPSVASSNSPIDLFDHFDNEKAKKIVDIYFYTVNVWRESVSAYVSQNDPIMRRKVLTRLTQLIAMEQKIKEILLTVPDDYVPPTCIFLTESSVSRNNILRFKKPFGELYASLYLAVHINSNINNFYGSYKKASGKAKENSTKNSINSATIHCDGYTTRINNPTNF